MEAANRRAFEGKSLSVGLNILLPAEQMPNPWQNISLSYRHFFARKVALAKYADAFVLFPGGFGTLDEMMEILTLIQTHKSRHIPVVLVGKSFWAGFIAWIRDSLLGNGMISESDLNLMTVVDEVDEALDAIFSFYKQRALGPSEEERQQMLYL